MSEIVERMTALAFEGEWELLREMVLADLLEGGSHINARNAEGVGVLHTVVRTHGDDAAEMVRMLLAAGADPDMADAEGVTPLHWCVIESAHRGEPQLGGAVPAAPGRGGCEPGRQGWLDSSVLLRELPVSGDGPVPVAGRSLPRCA